MTKSIRIPIPPYFDNPVSDVNLVAYIQQFVEDELAPALDTDVWEFDERAHVYKVEVNDAKVTTTGLLVFYTVFFDAFYGCRDMNSSGEDEREVSGTRTEGCWIFHPNVPRERRSTLDEF